VCPGYDSIPCTDWSPFTYHWDNIHFDGPVLPARPAYRPAQPVYLSVGGPSPDASGGPVVINVPPDAALNNPVLWGLIDSYGNNSDVDPANTSHWRQYRVNGGPWTDFPLLKNYASGAGDRSTSTFRIPLAGVHAGNNTFEFRYPVRPPQMTWQGDGYRIQQVELQLDPASAVTTTSGATSTPTPTRAATATPVSTTTLASTATPVSTATAAATLPPGAQRVTYDDVAGQDRVLNGQYPAGVIDWGTNGWYLAAPWGAFTTKSVGFNGQGPTSASFSFVTPRRLVSLQAYNGSRAATTTVTLACAGQPPTTTTLAAGQLATITTGWTTPCTSVTVGSTNGWDTNFDNLIIDSGV
jgi:hypothetical protein